MSAGAEVTRRDLEAVAHVAAEELVRKAPPGGDGNGSGGGGIWPFKSAKAGEERQLVG